MGDIEVYTAREVAEMFRVEVKTVARWARQGLIPGVKTPGAHWRYPKASIDEVWKRIQENG